MQAMISKCALRTLLAARPTISLTATQNLMFRAQQMRLFAQQYQQTRVSQPSRLQHRGKGVKLRGFTSLRDDMQLSIVPYPASYKENDNTFTVQKPGYFSVDFVPFTEVDGAKKPDTLRRKTMIVTMKTVRKLLDYDADEVIKTEKDNLTFITYKTKDDDPVTRVLNLKKVPNQEHILFQYVEVSESGNTDGKPSEVVITFDEMKNLQLLLEYSIPAIMGWNALYDTSVVESSLASSSSARSE